MIEKVYFFTHTHTDIGYTHPQEEVAEQQADNIARAIELCRLTEDRPEESRFAWTIETGWTLGRFWEEASPEQRGLLARYAREGRIQITASYLHMTQLVPPELLIRSLEPTFAIARECGVTIDTAMSSDINGVNWFEAHLLPQVGVRYLNTAINTTRGGAPVPAERPGGFWWESPAGDRLFVWNNVVYMTGNWAMNFPEDPSYELLQTFLQELESNGYPYDTAIIPVQGYIIDNARPNVAICDMVEEFNRQAGRTLCRLVTLGEALRDVAGRYGGTVPVRQGAWPDWWDDGIASSAFETGVIRYAHGDFFTAEKAASLANAFGASWPFCHGELDRMRENMLLYDEHTWGWWRSVEDPYSIHTRASGHHKTKYAEDAYFEGERYRERAVRTLASHVVPDRDTEQIFLFNPLAWPRKETVHWNVRWRYQGDTEPTAVRVLDQHGREVPAQNRLVPYVGHFRPHTDLWVDFEAEVPAMGYAIYRIEETGQPVSPIETANACAIENDFYRVEADEHGHIVSLYDKTLRKELAGDGPWHLNQLLYEQITSPGGRGDVLGEVMPPFDFTPGRAEVQVTTPQRATLSVQHDALGSSLLITSSMEHFPSIRQEIRLDKGRKSVDFVTTFVKEEVDETEAVYVAFPFLIEPAGVCCDISGGAFEPGKGQIPGTATDWYNVQHGAQLRGDGLTITWLCAEAPLAEFGEMKTGKTPSPPILHNGTIYSYALNNHWFTNFFARQSGEFTLRYRVLSAAEADVSELGRGGRELLTPLSAVRVGPPSARDVGVEIQQPGGAAREGSFAEITAGTAAVDAIRPARNGKGWMLRVYEIGGNEGSARLRLHWPVAVRAELCDVREQPQSELPLDDGELEIQLKPFATATILLRARGTDNGAPA